MVTSKKSGLLSWLWNAPVKFAFLSFALVFGITIVYMFANEIFQPGAALSPTFTFTILFLAMIFSAYKLIKWLPKYNLDRRSFVAIGNGLNLIYFSIFFILTILIASSTQDLVFYLLWLQTKSITLFLIITLFGSLVYLYLLGTFIANIYLIYRRGVSMGIPKWKIILSFPFTFSMFWITGYLLPEDKKTKPAITINKKWYSEFTDWVIKKPINTVFVFLIITLLSGLFFDVYSSYLTIMFIILFGIWVWAVGMKKFQNVIGKSFANFVFILNLIIVLGVIGFMIFEMKNQPKFDHYESIQITENMQK